MITSVSEVTSVQATIAGRNTALVSSGFERWKGTLSLDGLPRGRYTLVVTASNSGGQSVQAQREFLYDKPPVLTVTSPVDYGLGRPDVRVTAQCVDDGPSCQIKVTIGNTSTVLAVAYGSIDTVVTLPDGETRLKVAARDSEFNQTEVTRTLFISSNRKLVPEATFPGKILDIETQRALIFDDVASPRVVRLVDRVANTSEIIWTASNATEWIFAGHLTPGGTALIAIDTPSVPGSPPTSLREWRGGVLSEIGRIQLGTLVVKNTWALFTEFLLPCCSTNRLVLRDLTTGTNTIVSTTAGRPHNDVTPDGRVVYWSTPSPNEVFEFDPGPPSSTTPLTAAAPLWSFYTAADGVNVVFARVTNGVGPQSIVLRTAAGVEETLATLPAAVPGEYYQLAGGWTAFVRVGTGGSQQVWVREPDGTQRQLSSTGGLARIESINENGDVVYFTAAPSGSSVHMRYLAQADGTIIDLGRRMGAPFFVDGDWYIAAGPHLLEVDNGVPARSILAEGATGTFFTTDIAILNPSAAAAPVTIRYLREGAPEIQETRTLPARSRTTIHANEVPGLESTSVSVHIDAPDHANLVVERLMSWDGSGYGGHLGNAVSTPRLRWMFAEGAQGFFSTFFLLANSGAAEATVRFTFLMEQGAPVVHTITVPAASRKTLYAGDLPALVHGSFATIIESDVPVVAERAMYFGGSPLWFGGHGSPGVPEPAESWFHAEGATGSLFDTYILIANPHAQEVWVYLSYRTDSGVSFTKSKLLPPLSRLTINLEEESPDLANTAVSTHVSTQGPGIVSERAMYWGTTGTGWREAHNSFGATATGTKWGLAEGRAGGDRGYQTYVLVSNATFTAAELKVTFIREDGTAIERPYTVAKGQRLNINASDIPQLANANFSTIVESINSVEISVESAIYWNVNGVIWEGGGNTTATRLP